MEEFLYFKLASITMYVHLQDVGLQEPNKQSPALNLLTKYKDKKGREIPGF